MKIYTKGGDKGKTGIRGGQRVDKDDVRIEANGSLDELNSTIGLVRAYLPKEHEWQAPLYRIQHEMMIIMSQVATPEAIRDSNPNKIDETLLAFCEELIDSLTEKMGKSEYFILPGGTLVSAHLHQARSVARRSERRLWTLHKADPLPEIILKLVNRLSDLFFTMARYDLFAAGNEEERWKLFLYKKSK